MAAIHSDVERLSSEEIRLSEFTRNKCGSAAQDSIAAFRPTPQHRIHQRAKDLLGHFEGREQHGDNLPESVPLLLGFGDDRNEPGVLDLGQVVLEGWKAPGRRCRRWGHSGVTSA